MYEPRLLKDKAALEKNYNKDIIFILLLPPYPFLYPPPYFPLPPLEPSPLLPPFLFPFFFFPPYPSFLLFPPPFFLLLGRSVYRPREISHNPTRSLKTPSKKGYSLLEGFNLFLNFIKVSNNFNKVSINFNLTRLLIL